MKTRNYLFLAVASILFNIGWMTSGRAGSALGASPVRSSLFPLCWGGTENQQLYFTSGALQRVLVLYRNDLTTDATGVQFQLSLPVGFTVVHACNSNGYSLLKTTVSQQNIVKNSEGYVRYTLPMYDIPAGFKPAGDNVSEWSEWPGWYTYFIIQGNCRPGKQIIYWKLSSSQSTETEQSSIVDVLPPLPVVNLPQSMRVGLWLYSPLGYGTTFTSVEDQIFDTLAAAGVGKVILKLYPAYGYDIATRRVTSVHRHPNMKAMSSNDWPYYDFGPSEPPDNTTRSYNASLQPIPGNAWCPEYVKTAGAAYQTSTLNDITNCLTYTGADGYTLDYEGTAAPGYSACDICFCTRCRSAFESYIGHSVANWPGDVRPGGSLNGTWLTFRGIQNAGYPHVIANAARAGNANALTETWSGGYYQPYPTHLLYSQICSDITKFAPYLSHVTVGTYTYPTDPNTQLIPTPGFGTDPANWGATLADMMKVVADTVGHVSSSTRVIPCCAGAHSLGATATPLSSVTLLRYEALKCLYDGAQGFDFWGLGPFEDGRYLSLMNELARTFSAVETYILQGTPAASPVVNPPAGVLSKAWSYNGKTMVMSLNTSINQNFQVTIQVNDGMKASNPADNFTFQPNNNLVTLPLLALHGKFVLIESE